MRSLQQTAILRAVAHAFQLQHQFSRASIKSSCPVLSSPLTASYSKAGIGLCQFQHSGDVAPELSHRIDGVVVAVSAAGKKSVRATASSTESTAFEMRACGISEIALQTNRRTPRLGKGPHSIIHSCLPSRGRDHQMLSLNPVPVPGEKAIQLPPLHGNRKAGTNPPPRRPRDAPQDYRRPRIALQGRVLGGPATTAWECDDAQGSTLSTVGVGVGPRAADATLVEQEDQVTKWMMSLLCCKRICSSM